jgi:transcriptional adapter 2-alpha
MAEGERYDHAKAQRVRPPVRALYSVTDTYLQVSAKQANYRDAVIVTYDRIPSRQGRPPTGKTPRPTSALTLANSTSLHLLTVLEQQLCSTLRILPRPYLFLKEALMREWVRTGGKMGCREARLVVSRSSASNPNGLGAAGEWGEKVERVWEFLVETGGLRPPVRPEGEVVEVDVDQVMEEGGSGGLRPVVPSSNGLEAVSGVESGEVSRDEPMEVSV